MPAWLPKTLTRIRELAAARRVLFTLKARRELAQLDLGLDEVDACDALSRLEQDDFFERRASVRTLEWMYVFKPSVGGTVLYVKVIVRGDCIVISFHEDEEEEAYDEDA
jgi:hypothetical protein